MKSKFSISFLLLIAHDMLLNCASASVHSHDIDNNLEREKDGSFKHRDAEHYDESGHNYEFDHEAILGSVKEAEEYDKLSPEAAKKRLSELVLKIDLNKDKYIDKSELKQWILISFSNLSREEAAERFTETDTNKDGVISWPEYLMDNFGVSNEGELELDEHADSVELVRDERAMWVVADTNGDDTLDLKEFEVYSNPEEHPDMHIYLTKSTLREKDRNNDGKIDLQEYLGDRTEMKQNLDKEEMIVEQDKFYKDLDMNKDGFLDVMEIQKWIIPNNDEIAIEEVEHLFSLSDDDNDQRLSYDEVVAHHNVFVGSDSEYGNSMMYNEHFQDEL